MTRKQIIALVGAIIAVAGVAYALQVKPEKKPELKLETARVDRGPITAKVTASGTLSALVTVQVGSQVSGRIAQILVDFNATVTKGQVIAKLDPQLFEAALEQTRANSLAARANLRRAKVQAAEAAKQYERTKSLAEKKLIATADLDTAEAARDSAAAQVEAAEGALAQAEAALHQAQINLAYTTIVSPINGTVISRNVDVGQTVAASLQAPTLFVIAEDLRKMQVDTSVAEADIGKLSPGMTATFFVDAYPGERFSGTVRQIRNAAQTVQNVVTYDAVIDVDNPELKLRPGMTANVSFIYASAQDVLRVPSAALRFRPTPQMLAGGRGPRREVPPGTRVVWVEKGAAPQPVQIKTGISDGSLVEVVEGELAEGDTVIISASGGGGDSSGPRPPGGGRGGMRMF